MIDSSPQIEGVIADQVAMPSVSSPRAESESRILWSAGEGQVANAGVFVFALLFCWLLVPVVWAIYRFWRTARHRYVLTDQRLLEESGIIVKHVETLELYRVKDLSVAGTVMQTLFGRGQIIIQSTDATTPTLTVNAVPNPVDVSHLMRDAIERCRVAKGVRAFDY